jgi:two-component system, LytTR family, response regulator LytT
MIDCSPAMRDSKLLHVGYWGVVYLFLALLFGLRGEYVQQSLLFALLLMPVTMGATYVVSYRLIPAYLGRDPLQFVVWLALVLVASFYLILLLITGLFIVVAENDLRALNPAIHDFFYAMGGAFVAVAPAVTARALRVSQAYHREVQALRGEMARLTADSGTHWLHVRVDGRSERIRVDEIRYLESFGDHVHLHINGGARVTREPLYSILERLPDSFVRTHRSYAVNTSHCRAFTREDVAVGTATIPISRTYRANVLDRLGGP